MLQAARWKYRMQKIAKNLPSADHRTTLLGYIFTAKACIDNRTKMLKSNTSSTCPHYGELQPTNGWDWFVSLGYSSKFQQVSHLGFVTARHSSNGRQLNFAALNRERQLYSAGRPSRWALAHILVWYIIHCIHTTTVSWLLHRSICAGQLQSRNGGFLLSKRSFAAHLPLA